MLTALLDIVAKDCTKGFFGFKPWYHYLEMDSQCNIENFELLGSKSDIPLILLAVIDDLLRLAGLVAVFFIIYGGIMYATSQGSADQTSKAQSTIINALAGLAVAIIAVVFVSFLGNRLS